MICAAAKCGLRGVKVLDGRMVPTWANPVAVEVLDRSTATEGRRYASCTTEGVTRRDRQAVGNVK
jgi:hypothetical protein